MCTFPIRSFTDIIFTLQSGEKSFGVSGKWLAALVQKSHNTSGVSLKLAPCMNNVEVSLKCDMSRLQVEDRLIILFLSLGTNHKEDNSEVAYELSIMSGWMEN